MNTANVDVCGIITIHSTHQQGVMNERSGYLPKEETGLYCI